jgi:glucokinase
MVRDFLPHAAAVKTACFGVAGPVIDGIGEITNLSWRVQAPALSHDLHIENVRLINDLVATGYGIAELKENDCLALNAGRSLPAADMAVIAAGTGLGECLLHRETNGYVPLPSEAGHADYSPHDEITCELASYLRETTGSACVEQVLSGPGLVNIYRFLRDRGEAREDPATSARMETEDPAAVVANSGLEGGCLICTRAVDIFVSAYGAEAGNLALRTLAVGGVYVAGGIAPRLRSRMQAGEFMKAFVNKPKQEELMRQVPVRLALHNDLPLLGALRFITQNHSLAG